MTYVDFIFLSSYTGIWANNDQEVFSNDYEFVDKYHGLRKIYQEAIVSGGNFTALTRARAN